MISVQFCIRYLWLCPWMIPLEVSFLCEPSLLSPLLPSWYFICFYIPPSALSWELWVLKSASAKGRSVDLNMDAGKCQLSNSEQHPSIWQLQRKKSLPFPIKINVSRSGGSYRTAGSSRLHWLAFSLEKSWYTLLPLANTSAATPGQVSQGGDTKPYPKSAPPLVAPGAAQAHTKPCKDYCSWDKRRVK